MVWEYVNIEVGTKTRVSVPGDICTYAVRIVFMRFIFQLKTPIQCLLNVLTFSRVTIFLQIVL